MRSFLHGSDPLKRRPPSAASCAMPERRYPHCAFGCTPLVFTVCLRVYYRVYNFGLRASDSARVSTLGVLKSRTGSANYMRPPLARYFASTSLPVFEQHRGQGTMSSKQDENVAQQQPGDSDGYSPFKMGGSPYSPFKNGAPEPHRTSHQMSRSRAFAHVVACCAQATRRRRHRRRRRSPLRCGPPGFPRLAARPPAASVGRHEAAARV